MKITIIVPVYNAGKFLNRCIESIISQTHQKLEIILINDGSVDNSLEICKKYAIIDKRIIVIDQKNHGQAHARNAGLKIATGNYIGFIDADDFIDADMYESLAAISLKFCPDVVVSNFKLCHPNSVSNKVIKNALPYGKLLTQNEIKDFFIKPYYGGSLGIIPVLWNKIYKSDFIKSNHFVLDERGRAEDYWFNFYAFKIASTVFAIDKSFYNYYYFNEGSVMNTFRENQFEYYLNSRQELINCNEEFKFDLKGLNFGLDFLNNTNEYILLCIKKKGLVKSFKKVRLILKNQEFQNVFSKSTPNRSHTKIIKKLLNFKSYFIVFLIYYTWSKKLI